MILPCNNFMIQILPLVLYRLLIKKIQLHLFVQAFFYEVHNTDHLFGIILDVLISRKNIHTKYPRRWLSHNSDKTLRVHRYRRFVHKLLQLQQGSRSNLLCSFVCQSIDLTASVLRVGVSSIAHGLRTERVSPPKCSDIRNPVKLPSKNRKKNLSFHKTNRLLPPNSPILVQWIFELKMGDAYLNSSLRYYRFWQLKTMWGNRPKIRDRKLHFSFKFKGTQFFRSSASFFRC